ncbi:hypothetical protein EP073_13250 [Geovibrio thiophilus]|uniref:PilZ domain-containing protein n=1 Tax=Geovibrio thiophilus TaxID=139438 RepID=A0A3R5Z107_9BACT|nr:PilZ domain-containing protein [Geovibrio thiophilus]QAR34335.1 hypothetical protein EP073_13250 [Geovibrio thiophilus]
MIVRARLSIIYPDDIRTVYGQIASKAPLVLQLASYSPALVADCLEMTLQWHEAGSSKCVQVEFLKAEGAQLFLKVVKDLRGRAECAHRVEYKGFFDIKRITADEYASCARNAERNNAANKNSIVNKIQSVIPNETVSNQHLFRLLMEMDSKLERLVYLAETDGIEKDFQTVKALYISSEGCGFFTDESLKIGELFFLEARSFDTGGRLRFSAVGKVAGGRKTKLGILADLEFSDMEEAVKENIIRYVFEKDRELLKEARDK